MKLILAYEKNSVGAIDPSELHKLLEVIAPLSPPRSSWLHQFNLSKGGQYASGIEVSAFDFRKPEDPVSLYPLLSFSSSTAINTQPRRQNQPDMPITPRATRKAMRKATRMAGAAPPPPPPTHTRTLMAGPV